MAVEEYKRAITHQNYGAGQAGLEQYHHRVYKEITERPKGLTLESVRKKRNFTKATDTYMLMVHGATVAPIWGGGVAFIMVLIFLTHLGEEMIFFEWLVFGISCITTIYFAIYYFRMPKKESILNRQDGLVTIPGFYYQPNSTMRFADALFSYSTGGEDAMGAFKLQIIRPTKGYTFYFFSVGWGCYADISLITWYMDKNRPLPPGDAFDAYRQQDYERRKAEGFPKPLYPSTIPTPEATPEQQAERKRIGGW
ncbi:hypothetical protein [Aquimarina longa]|uniref:hypothetical protein n=1 Tax=Aquimarina longa TaxID=1080221 RepID=UPI0007812D5F|nr:hypothetical protein [Aquimarina longa]